MRNNEPTPKQIAEDRKRWKHERAQRLNNTVDNRVDTRPPPVVVPTRKPLVVPQPLPKERRPIPAGILDIPVVRAREDAARARQDRKDAIAARLTGILGDVSDDSLTAGGHGGWFGPPKGNHVPEAVPGGDDESGGTGTEKKSVLKARREKREAAAVTKEANSKVADDHYKDPPTQPGNTKYPYGDPPHPERANLPEDDPKYNKVWGDSVDEKGRPYPGSPEFGESVAISKATLDKNFHVEKAGQLSDASRKKLSKPDGELLSPVQTILDSGEDMMVMDRHARPGSRFAGPDGTHSPEVRTANGVVIDQGERLQRKAQLDGATSRLARVKSDSYTGADAVADQRKRVGGLETLDKKIRDPEAYNPTTIRNAAQKRVDAAVGEREGINGLRKADRDQKAGERKLKADQERRAGLVERGKSTAIVDRDIKASEQKIQDAKDALGGRTTGFSDADQKKAQKKVEYTKDDQKRADKRAGEFEKNPQAYRDRKIFENGEALKVAKERLGHYEEDPAEAKLEEVRTHQSAVDQAQSKYDKTRTGYAFLTDKDASGNKINLASRLDVPNDRANLENWKKQGNGRDIMMEGSLKTHSLREGLAEERPDAAVGGIPAVALWRHQDIYDAIRQDGQGEEHRLYPDADWHKNPNVQREAFAFQARIQTEGGGRVIIRSPQVDAHDDVRVRKQPSGAPEKLKATDDVRAVGEKVNQFDAMERVVPPREAFDLSEHWAANTKSKVGAGYLKENSRDPAERTLRAVSTIVGPEGSGTISWKTLSDAADIGDGEQLKRSLKNLEDAGEIERISPYHITEDGRRVRAIDAATEKRLGLSLTDDPFVDPHYEQSDVFVIKKPERLSKDTQLAKGGSVASPAGAKYYSELYGVSLQVGDPIPVGKIPEGGGSGGGLTASGWVRRTRRRR